MTKNNAKPTPWGEWLKAATRLGIPPESFWRLSLKEWRALIQPTSQAISRGTLNQLVALAQGKQHHDE